MTDLIPLANRIFVKPDPSPDGAGDGIIRPDSARKAPSMTGVILRMGPEAPTDLSVGQRIAWGQFSGNELLVDGQSVKVLSPEEVWATFQETT